MASIRLNKTISEENGRFRLKIYVSETSDNIPGAVFLYHKAPVTAAYENVFTKVCSYADLLNYPESTADSEMPYFRRGHIDRLYDSYTQAEEFWVSVKTGTQTLLDDIAVIHNAAFEETVLTYA